MSVIFDRYYRRILKATLMTSRDAQEAEDGVQIVFTDFYQEAELFDEAKGIQTAQR